MRFLPAAITPVSMADIFAAAADHMHGIGLSVFERRLAEYFGANSAYTFSSLMRTNYACLVSLSKGSARKKVILPRYSCPSFVHAVIAAGLVVQYCDVDPVTLAFDVTKLSEMDMSNTLAIICANLFGLTNPIDQIVEIARKQGVLVIEGVDYGIGTTYKNKRIGMFGDVTILNFQEGKAIPVGGGAIVTNNRKVINRFSGQRKALFPNIVTMLGFSIFSKPAWYAIFINLVSILGVKRKRFSMEDTIRKTNKETDFHFDSRDFDKSLSNFQGALGCRILSRLDSDMSARGNNASALKFKLCQIQGIKIIDKILGVQVVHYIRLPVLVGMGKRDMLLGKLLDAGVEASPMYIEHGMSIDKENYPGAFRVAYELLTIPCHPFITTEDVAKIISVTQSAMGR